nr:DUF3833 domain-containing protein [Pseudobdellovibrionaceae bacterium]
MNKFAKPIGSLLSLFFLGCTTAGIQDYKETKPDFIFEKYFNGPMIAKGVFQKRNGLVTRRFTIAMEGSWQGNQGTLKEDFIYDDGEKYHRTWYITKQEDGSYIGTASDILGESRGEVKGFALRWKYTMALPVDGKVYNVDFDDWMYLLDDHTLINKSHMSKFGYELGQV